MGEGELPWNHMQIWMLFFRKFKIVKGGVDFIIFL